MSVNPFVAALGPALDAASPGVRHHFSQHEGTRLYRGTLHRVWRRGGWQGRLVHLALWLGRNMGGLPPEIGAGIPFEVEHRIVRLEDGRTGWTWARRFQFVNATRDFSAVMTYDPVRGTVVDWIGRDRRLEAVLHPAVEEGALVLRSGRQRLRVGTLWLPFPRWLSGHTLAREWEEPDGALGVSVTISNPLLGAVFGYEGTFGEVAAADDHLAHTE